MADEAKLFSRVLTKDVSTAETRNSSNSFRVYYGGSPAGVPFRWESQPGTPKHKLSDDFIPPLTPPPSYYFTRNSDKSMEKNRARLNLLRSLFPKLSTGSKSSFYSVSSSSASRVSSCSSPTAFLSPKSKNLFRCFVGRYHSPSLPDGECQECIDVHSWQCLRPTCC